MLTKRVLVIGYLFSLLLINLHTTESVSYQEDNAEAVAINEQKQIRTGRRSGNGQSRGRRRSCDPLYRYLFETCGQWPFSTTPSLDNPFLPYHPHPSPPRPRPSPRLPPPPLVPSPPPPPPSPLVPSPPPPSSPPFFEFPSPPPPVIVYFPPPLVPSPPPPLPGGDSMMQPPPLWLPPPSLSYETPPVFSLPPPYDEFPPMPPITWLPPPVVTAQSSPEMTEGFDQIPPPLK